MSPDPESPLKRVVLDQETLIPISVLSLLVCSIAGGAVWLNDRMTSIDYRLQMIEEQVGDRWTRSDMLHWVEVLESRNASINVPPVIRTTR